MTSDVAVLRAKTNALLERLRHATAVLDAERESLAIAEERVACVQQAQEIVQTVAQAVEQQVHARIAEVVSRCLRAVFDDPYEFRVEFDRRRGRTEARLVLVRDGIALDDPLNEVGGGVVDVAALALRIACLLLCRPACRRLLVLDEPFRNIRGDENRRRTRELLLGLANDLGMQIILNTDIPAYRLGTVLELGGC